MHPNPAFRRQPAAEALEAAAERSFGVLTIAAGDAPLAAHVPFVLDADATTVEAHLVRSNPIARALKGGALPALLIVSGPDGYVSPDWYGEADKVPTWNYLAVHLRGSLALAPQVGMRAHLDRLSAVFERRLPKTPWTADKMSAEALASMMRQIVPVTMAVERVDSTVKLNQNRTRAARLGAAEAIGLGGTPGMETAALAAMMRAVEDD